MVSSIRRRAWSHDVGLLLRFARCRRPDPLPCRFLTWPGCVLPGNGEVQGILPHLDEAQLDYLCQMLPVDYQTSFGGKALQCLA